MTLALSGALTVRHAQVRRLLVDASIDALVVSHLPNIFYLTNFSGSSAIAVLTQETLHFVTDFRYMTALSALQASPSARKRSWRVWLRWPSRAWGSRPRTSP